MLSTRPPPSISDTAPANLSLATRHFAVSKRIVGIVCPFCPPLVLSSFLFFLFPKAMRPAGGKWIASGRDAHAPTAHPRPSRVSMSAERFSWFSMPTFLLHSSRPLCFLFVLLCKILPLQALRASASPRELFPPALQLPPWRTWRTLHETCFRPPSSLHPLSPTFHIRG